MSFTFEVKGDATNRWPLSPTCVSQIERLRPGAGCDAIAIVFGDSDTQAGQVRQVLHDVLLKGVESLLPLVRAIPGGFGIVVPKMFEGAQLVTDARGIGPRINGKDYMIDCRDDYWRQVANEDLMAVLRGEIEPERHYEPAEIATDNMGIIRIEPKKGKANDLTRLLRDVKRSLVKETAEELLVTWG